LSKKDENILTYLINSADEGNRIDRFLTAKMKDVSRSYIQDIIIKGQVRVNGKPVNKNYRINENDTVVLEGYKERQSDNSVEPQKINLKIIYEDKYLLVVSKKPGMITHPVPGFYRDTLVNALLYYYGELSTLSGRERAGIVHRLDKNTSGLLIVAKDNKTHRLLSDKFRDREIKKTYVALVLGYLSEEKGEIILPIGRSRMDRKKMSISIDKGREAATRFEVTERFKCCTLLNVCPRTGRTHQIRVHLSYIGHPVIGDNLYGNSDSMKMSKELEMERQFLHAKRLEFDHPVTGEKILLEDELSDDLLECLELLRNKYSIK
jgi:23S rRNA pseudouridine1911/1915/1917 synthase